MKINGGRYRTFFFFLFTVFLWCSFSGGAKFFMKNLAKDHFIIEPSLLLERIAAFMSIGSFTAYLIGGSIALMFSVRHIVIFTALFPVFTLLFLYTFLPESFFAIALSAFMIGLMYGLFALLRSVITYLEIKRTGLPDTAVNGIVTMTFIFAIILGAFFSTLLFERIGSGVLPVFLSFLVIAACLALALRYEDPAGKQPFLASMRTFVTDSKWILRQKWLILVASSGLWAISTVVCLKAIPFTEEHFGIPESQSSLILLFAALGAIVGNLLTVRTKKHRFLFFRLYAYAFAILVFLFLSIVQSFPLAIAYSLLIGIMMGAATNLVDSYYLSFVGDNGKKENGAAIHGAFINLTLAILLLSVRIVPDRVVFIILGCLAAIFAFLIRIYLGRLEKTS